MKTGGREGNKKKLRKKQDQAPQRRDQENHGNEVGVVSTEWKNRTVDLKNKI